MSSFVCCFQWTKMIFYIFFLFCLYILGRSLWLLFSIKRNRNNHIFPKYPITKNQINCMIVMGSGGHTAEILRLTDSLNDKLYNPRHYVIANTDKISRDKVVDFENSKVGSENYQIYYIPRSREVKQSWSTSVISTIYAALYSFPLVFKVKPNLVLVNGPGTCIPICVAAFLLTVLGRKVYIVFVESICRVKTLSMTGKILYFFADQLIVQWPELKTLYPETQYFGRIV